MKKSLTKKILKKKNGHERGLKSLESESGSSITVEWINPLYRDPDLQARLNELRSSLKGCFCAKIQTGDSVYYCKKFCPESVNHVPVLEDINHVFCQFSWSGHNYVCLFSGCRSSHEKDEPVKEVSMEDSEDRNREVADKKDLKAIKKEPPAPEDITIECHYCDAEFTDKISLINHRKIIHKAGKSDSKTF